MIRPKPPLHQRMIALAACGHDHASALKKCGEELRDALAAMDESFSAVTMRECLRLQQRARLTWWRATGEHVSSCD